MDDLNLTVDIEDLNDIPLDDGGYDCSIVECLADGRAILRFLEGPYTGQTFISEYVVLEATKTVH